MRITMYGAIEKMPERLSGLQSLRGIAALLVVIAHAIILATDDLHFSLEMRDFASATGAYGVFVFFVISGFIMIVTTYDQFGRDRAPTTFFLKRVLRIVPLYWAVTLVYAARKVLAGGSYSAWEIVASMFFIPYGSGSMEPILGLGWTLNYEMFFYAVFAVCLLTSAKLGVTILLITFSILVVAGAFVPANAPAPLSYWTRPVILYFAAGVVVGLLYRRYANRIPRPELRLWTLSAVAVAICAVPSVYLAATSALPDHQVAGPIVAILAVSLVVFVKVSLPSNAVERGLQLIGDASYSIYLTHLFTHIPIVIIWRALGLPASLGWLFYLGALVSATLLGIAVYLWFERPVGSWARDLIVARRLRKASIVEAVKL